MHTHFALLLIALMFGLSDIAQARHGNSDMSYKSRKPKAAQILPGIFRDSTRDKIDSKLSKGTAAQFNYSSTKPSAGAGDEGAIDKGPGDSTVDADGDTRVKRSTVGNADLVQQFTESEELSIGAEESFLLRGRPISALALASGRYDGQQVTMITPDGDRKQCSVSKQQAVQIATSTDTRNFKDDSLTYLDLVGKNRKTIDDYAVGLQCPGLTLPEAGVIPAEYAYYSGDQAMRNRMRGANPTVPVLLVRAHPTKPTGTVFGGGGAPGGGEEGK